jgi:mRNA interferase MazF
MSFPHRGEIYLVEFDPTRGHGIKKTRPALVIQNDIGNRHSAITIVAAITSKLSPKPYPIEVIVQPSYPNGLSLVSAIHLDQLRSIDRELLVKRLGVIDQVTMRKVETAIEISLGLMAV